MPQLKAILFEINGVFLKDDTLQFELIDEILLTRNLQPTDQLYRSNSFGKSDRRCLQENLALRGRILSSEDIDALIAQKAIAYQQRMASFDSFSFYKDVLTFINTIRTEYSSIHLGIVTGYCRADAEFILQQGQLETLFDVLISADDAKTFKPDNQGYQLAIAQLNKAFPDEQISAENCLAVEDNFYGIQAAKSLGIPVVGLAHTYPFHMLQRCSNWCVDFLDELELERIDPSLLSIP